MNKETNQAQSIYKELLEIEAAAKIIRAGKNINRIEIVYKKRYGKKIISELWSMLNNKKTAIKAFLGMRHNKVIAHFENSRITIHARE